METIKDRRTELGEFVSSPFYDHWRSRVEATGGCQQPVRLSGAYRIEQSGTGRILHEHSGQIMVACGTRRAGLCQPCADRYAADAFHLIRAGLTGDDGKHVPASVEKAPRLFATLTAPSFGRIHTRRLSNRGFVIPCACGEKHRLADPRVNGAIDSDSYDYEAAVLWQAHSGDLWNRFTVAFRRHLARFGGIKVRDLADHLVVSYAKVAEYQKRGLVHFHAVIRVDGPTGPGSDAPNWVTAELMAEVVRLAARAVRVDTWRPTGEVLRLSWGTQVDTQPIAATDVDSDGKTAAAIAGYIAKYSTKDSGATETGIDRPIRSRQHIDMVKASEHHKQMMRTAWDLGGLACYEHLNLRRAAHKLGFRGHYLTKSQRYSTTFQQLRATRQLHRFAELLSSLDVTEDEITVINGWEFTGVGHKTEAERELAQAIGERKRNKQSRKE